MLAVESANAHTYLVFLPSSVYIPSVPFYKVRSHDQFGPVGCEWEDLSHFPPMTLVSSAAVMEKDLSKSPSSQDSPECSP